MFNTLRGAMLAQLSVKYSLPDGIRNQIIDLAQQNPARIQAAVESHYVSARDEQSRMAISSLRTAMMRLNKDLQFEEDCATLLANYEKLTGHTFEAPEWMACG